MLADLLFITSHYSLQPTVDALRRLALPCETNVVPYDDLDHITQVFAQYAPSYDAVFISGTSARRVIALKHPKNPQPLVAYQVDSDALHRDLLRLAIENQDLDFRRIAVDFLVLLNRGFSVVDFLQLDDLSSVASQNEQLTDRMCIHGSFRLEDVILDRILSLWEQNAIDMVLCLYSSIVPALQERGIPFHCPFPSDDHLNRLIHDTLVKIELNRLHENHPAIIQVFPHRPGAGETEYVRRIHHCLQQYVQRHLIDGVLQETESCCTLISSMKVLRSVTNDLQSCLISSYMSEQLDFPVAVAYGVGTTVSHAMNNVQIASKEARLLGKPFVVDTNGTLIGPLNSDKRMEIFSQSLPDISQIAKQCGLSAMTIQKLITIVRSAGSDKITTQDLAQQLDSTVRNANRIIRNLCRGGVAKPVYSQTSHSRGRPVQVYALDFGVRLF